MTVISVTLAVHLLICKVEDENKNGLRKMIPITGWKINIPKIKILTFGLYSANHSISANMDKLKRALSGNDNNDEDSSTGIFSNLDSSMTLNWSTRIKAFAICFVIGVSLSLLGALALFMSKLALFAVFYTLGNVVSIVSSCFLMGPFKQVKKMFASTRIVATILVIVMFILTFISGLILKKAGLSLLCIILQSLAMTWYSLSYIPYARDAVKKTVSSCV